ncbi:Tll0287-like domain-containing protein [Pseudidiomarina sediminum]|nr:DUF3365 domain-containing protein [Pseudidiomarina sediminum]
MLFTTTRTLIAGILLSTTLPFVTLPAWAQDDSDTALKTQSRALAQDLQQQLSGKLKAAMQAQGPVHAIEVCHLEAPQIASRLSREQEVTVGRTALRVRNPNNQPTVAQAEVMKAMAAALADDASVVPEHVITQADGSQAYMRAIVMQPQCLACHGSSIAAPVQQAIQAKYPEDQATGFEVGDLRGAFLIEWLSK